MTSYSPSLALMVGEVCEEALAFLPLLKDVKAKLGPFFEIARYVAPEGLEPLNASLFPHLYTASYYTAMSRGAMRENYKFTSKITAGQDKAIKLSARKSVKGGRNVDEALILKLEAVGINVGNLREAIQREKTPRRRTRDESSSKEEPVVATRFKGGMACPVCVGGVTYQRYRAFRGHWTERHQRFVR